MVVLTRATTRPARLNCSTTPAAGFSHGSPTLQTGLIGPSITTPWSPETGAEAAAPAKHRASARAASMRAAERTAGTLPGVAAALLTSRGTVQLEQRGGQECTGFSESPAAGCGWLAQPRRRPR